MRMTATTSWRMTTRTLMRTRARTKRRSQLMERSLASNHFVIFNSTKAVPIRETSSLHRPSSLTKFRNSMAKLPALVKNGKEFKRVALELGRLDPLLVAVTGALLWSLFERLIQEYIKSIGFVTTRNNGWLSWRGWRGFGFLGRPRRPRLTGRTKLNHSTPY